MEALGKEDGIDFFSVRHEENTAHMADAINSLKIL
jgi:thiamine pyrophosphate-dependent acetolactate synthase large subunit-like protein